jgi:predicted DCC family thiol-disulfide oxidoreductase YuxK
MESQPAQSAAGTEQIELVYDGQCPVCTAYSCAVEVATDAGGPVRRVDARSGAAVVKRITAAGLDLDDGMVLVHGGRLYHGADALHKMATLAPCRGFRNRLNRLLFGSQAVSRLMYPALRAGRNALLRLLGRGKIRNLGTAGTSPTKSTASGK